LVFFYSCRPKINTLISLFKNIKFVYSFIICWFKKKIIKISEASITLLNYITTCRLLVIEEMHLEMALSIMWRGGTLRRSSRTLTRTYAYKYIYVFSWMVDYSTREEDVLHDTFVEEERSKQCSSLTYVFECSALWKQKQQQQPASSNTHSGRHFNELMIYHTPTN
jgi:hypothetical protein